MAAIPRFEADPQRFEDFRPVLALLTDPAPQVTSEPVGIVCRQCGCADLRVYRTVKLSKSRIRRERICRHCGNRLITTEQEALR